MEKKAKKNPPTIGAAGLNFSVRNGMRWNRRRFNRHNMFLREII